MNYVDEVKVAAYGRWIDLLVEVGGIGREYLTGKHAPCPKCGGKDRFRLIDEQEGAVLCGQCFSTKNGDGISAIQWMRDCSFNMAVDLVADRVGVKKRGRRKKEPEDDLKFEEWNSSRAEWCRLKKIAEETVIAEGGRMADWRGWGVIAIPILGKTADSSPRGYVIANRRGGVLKTRSATAKVLVTQGSKTGWIGKASLARLETARVIWKVEGVTDMLSLAGAIPDDLRHLHAVVTNPFGSTENPKRDLLEIFAGKLAVVVHDPDDAGEKGAAKWAAAIAEIADETRIVRLAGGLDLRDWLGQGGDFTQLRDLARAAEPIASGRKTSDQSEDSSTDEDEIEEEEDDNLRLAKLFLKQRRRRLVILDGAPHQWDGRRWKRATSLNDLRAQVLRSLEQEFVRIAHEQIEERKRKGEDPPKRKRINANLLGSVFSLVKSHGSIPEEIGYGSMIEWDGDEVVDWKKRNMISFRNGLLDLDALVEHGRTELIEHTPSWWSLASLPYDYDPSAPIGPQWTNFLQRNLAGDEKTIECLQEWMGYCLLPNTDHHKFLMMIGDGANGKSVFCAVVEAMLGEENVSHVPLELFGQRFALGPTLGKLVNMATETHDIDRIAEGHLKQFTDGSKMTFDRKGLPAVEARPTAKLMIATNSPPRFTDKSMGLWRRMIVLPFTVEIGRDERILGLDKPDWWTRREGELPGVFNWAVEGLRRLLTAVEFTVPEASETTKEEYRQDTNPAREFLVETYVACDPNAVSSPAGLLVSEVYGAYRKWCETNGYKQMGARTFGKEVRRAFPSAQRVRRFEFYSETGTPYGTRRWSYDGLREKTQAEEETE